jgi:hypothetical protein
MREMLSISSFGPLPLSPKARDAMRFAEMKTLDNLMRFKPVATSMCESLGKGYGSLSHITIRLLRFSE